MKYPYTFTAKVAQFPAKMYFTNLWIWKYYAFSVVLCIPIFYKIQKLGKNLLHPLLWDHIHLTSILLSNNSSS